MQVLAEAASGGPVAGLPLAALARAGRDAVRAGAVLQHEVAGESTMASGLSLRRLVTRPRWMVEVGASSAPSPSLAERDRRSLLGPTQASQRTDARPSPVQPGTPLPRRPRAAEPVRRPRHLWLGRVQCQRFKGDGRTRALGGQPSSWGGARLAGGDADWLEAP
jgi:hypothetical protein